MSSDEKEQRMSRDLEADLKLCAAATPGPWEWDYHRKQLVSRSTDMDITGGIDPNTGFEDCGVFIGSDDRDFIVAAREAWPETICELREAKKRIAELESRLEVLTPCGACDGKGWVYDLEDGGTMCCPECG